MTTIQTTTTNTKNTLAAIEPDLNRLAELEAVIKTLEKQKKQLQANIMETMEQNNVTTYENDNFKVTHVLAHSSVRFNSAQLRQELPTIYERYQNNMVKVKDSLRVTRKETD